ncbi:MAG TPA: alpha/beta hydrolase, partial [Bacillota bacterium]|nr:alpha/beta hydrolase [Bacillota bacterium]
MIEEVWKMKLSVFVFKFIDYTFDYVQNYYKYANIKTIKDVSYDDRSEACKLDILVKDGAEGPFPVYMNIHGGGYVAGDKKHRRSFCSHIASRGYFVFNINHGLSPEYKYPDQVRHCLNALNWIYDQKDRYNLDVDRILVGGDSAGGYL